MLTLIKIEELIKFQVSAEIIKHSDSSFVHNLISDLLRFIEVHLHSVFLIQDQLLLSIKLESLNF